MADPLPITISVLALVISSVTAWRLTIFRRALLRQGSTMTHDEYREAFAIPSARKGDAEHALKLALDIRKFEMDLYWKRATYFWAFLAVTLGAYFALHAAKDVPPLEKREALLIVSCLGVVFSVAWYFVNRASKFWQENWEKHVDLLEDAVIGPMYRTVISDEGIKLWRLWGRIRSQCPS